MSKKDSKKSSSKNQIRKLNHDVSEKDFVNVDVRKIKVNFNPRNKKQEEAFNSCIDNKITFLIGAVGSGKTTIGVSSALELLTQKVVDKIILLRPVKTSKKQELGFLKGGLEEKLSPLLLPLQSVFEKIVGRLAYDSMVQSEKIMPFAVNYVEGMTFDKSIILLDEFQNLEDDELQSVLTRIPDNSKVIVMGDRNQIKLDVPELSCSHNTWIFENTKNVSVIEFTAKDIVRGEITKIVENCFKKLKNKDLEQKEPEVQVTQHIKKSLPKKQKNDNMNISQDKIRELQDYYLSDI